MKNLIFKTLGIGAFASLVFTGCVVRERYAYGHRGGVVVRETVVAPVPPPPPPPPPIGNATIVTPSGPGEVIVTEAPPPPQVEVVTVRPGPEFIWVQGAWAWNGRWVWESGHWMRPPRPGVVWVAPHYVHRGRTHIWVRGEWR